MSFVLETSVEPAGYAERPAFANCYAVAGRFISLQTSNCEINELLKRYFAGWHVSAVPAPDGGSPDVSIIFHNLGDRPEPPANLIPFEVAEGGRCRTNGQIYFF